MVLTHICRAQSLNGALLKANDFPILSCLIHSGEPIKSLGERSPRSVAHNRKTPSGANGFSTGFGPGSSCIFRPLQTKSIGIELVSELGASKPFTFSRMRSFGLRSAMDLLISKKGTAPETDLLWTLKNFANVVPMPRARTMHW